MSLKPFILATLALTPAITHSMHFALVEITDGSLGFAVHGNGEVEYRVGPTGNMTTKPHFFTTADDHPIIKSDKITLGRGGELEGAIASVFGPDNVIEIALKDCDFLAEVNVKWRYKEAASAWAILNAIFSSREMVEERFFKRPYLVTSQSTKFAELTFTRPHAGGIIRLIAETDLAGNETPSNREDTFCLLSNPGYWIAKGQEK